MKAEELQQGNKRCCNLIIKMYPLGAFKSGISLLLEFINENNLPLLLSAICSRIINICGVWNCWKNGNKHEKSVRELLFNTKDDLKFLLKIKALREKLSDNLDLWSQKKS